jgi:hypothetical protein
MKRTNEKNETGVQNLSTSQIKREEFHFDYPQLQLTSYPPGKREITGCLLSSGLAELQLQSCQSQLQPQALHCSIILLQQNIQALHCSIILLQQNIPLLLIRAPF